MSDITKLPALRHLRGGPTTHVEYRRHGRVVRSGTGQSFWFRPLSAVVSELPVDDRELPLLFHARTADFQDVTVQASVTFRIADPAVAAGRIDFGVDPDTGRWRADPLQQVAGLLTETAQQHAVDLLARLPLAQALVTGVAEIRQRVGEGLAEDARLQQTGLAVLGVRVVAVRPEPEVERALQTPTREQVQQDADRATYERRAQAVEMERTISENELTSRIELARQEEQLVVRRGANARRQAEEEAAASAIQTRAAANREQELGEAQAAAALALGRARGQSEAARVDAYRELGPATLLALAAQELAGNLPEIGSLVIGPDVLTALVTSLTRASGPASPLTASRGGGRS
jgi:regulator of protease activity HflC (stomatin/prohibitin superfamily)